MASQFHNRLVGVTILVASVVIFLPTIIDGKKTAYQDEFVATPIKPQLREHTQQIAVEQNAATAEPDSPQAVATETTVENNQWEIQEVAEAVTTSAAQEARAAAVQNKTQRVTESVQAVVPEKAWTIQLGAFQNAQNINALLKKLHKAGFQAHTVPAEVIDGELTRVFVGPDVSKEKLEKQLPQLKRLTKLQGKLIAFNAVSP